MNAISADYGPSMNNKSFKYDGCIYRTFPIDYQIEKKGTMEEKVVIDYHSEEVYPDRYSQWSYTDNLKDELRISKIRTLSEYVSKLTRIRTSSHLSKLL
jgi:hypothetical protein